MDEEISDNNLTVADDLNEEKYYVARNLQLV